MIEHKLFDNLINECEAAKLLKKSVYWLRRRRFEKQDPTFYKYCGHVYYDRVELLRWIKKNLVKKSS